MSSSGPSGRSDFYTWQKRIGFWCKKRFPEQTEQTIEAHFREEVDELRSVVETIAYPPTESDTEKIGEEIADCMILLLALAEHLDISASSEVEKKMRTNYRRKWEYDPTLGYHKKVE